MFFGKRNEDSEKYDDPAITYGRLVQQEKNRGKDREEKSLFDWIFGSRRDSDFVYYDD